MSERDPVSKKEKVSKGKTHLMSTSILSAHVYINVLHTHTHTLFLAKKCIISVAI